tara:strand:- start:2265 stop:2660 length:396 start_codon:yes stop_codon:yes gene_type:complete
MRDIKFIMYDKAKNELTNPMLLEDLILKATLQDPKCFEWDCEIPIMQFTGIFDTTGVEIYEGDIVRYLDDETNKYLIDVVEYNSDMSCFLLKKQDSEYYPIYLESKTLGLIYDESITFEVVGNIHKNPDLI